MNKMQTQLAEPSNVDGVERNDLIEILIVLAKRKKLLIGLPLAAALSSAAISLAFPDVYRATATLLPPQQAQSSAAALLSQLGNFAGAAGGAAGIKNPNDLYVGMLKSRTVADRLIARFDLAKVYDKSWKIKLQLFQAKMGLSRSMSKTLIRNASPTWQMRMSMSCFD
jgi:uncharacterized protein involved in exopolysaccharide biosynthesis